MYLGAMDKSILCALVNKKDKGKQKVKKKRSLSPNSASLKKISKKAKAR